MVEFASGGSQGITVKFDVSEFDTVMMHAHREGLSADDALADLMEWALHQKACEICQEEKEATICPDAVMGLCEVSVKWPKTGPTVLFNNDDRQFVASVLAMSLREALTVVLYKKGFEGNHNVMERGDENNGSSKPVVP